jgi:hypothetical protein
MPARARGVIPTNPVHDLKIHPRDRELIVGTHGRGFFIADISAVEEITPTVLAADAHLFEIVPAIAWVVGQRTVTSSSNFAGVSRPNDIAINYYLKADAPSGAKVRVYDGSRVIAEFDGPTTAGINTVRWNMQARRDRITGEATGGAGGRGGRGGGGGAAGGGAAGGPAQTPAGVGQYRVVLSVNGRDYAQTAMILADPNPGGRQ